MSVWDYLCKLGLAQGTCGEAYQTDEESRGFLCEHSGCTSCVHRIPDGPATIAAEEGFELILKAGLGPKGKELKETYYAALSNLNCLWYHYVDGGDEPVFYFEMPPIQWTDDYRNFVIGDRQAFAELAHVCSVVMSTRVAIAMGEFLVYPVLSESQSIRITRKHNVYIPAPPEVQVHDDTSVVQLNDADDLLVMWLVVQKGVEGARIAEGSRPDTPSDRSSAWWRFVDSLICYTVTKNSIVVTEMDEEDTGMVETCLPCEGIEDCYFAAIDVEIDPKDCKWMKNRNEE